MHIYLTSTLSVSRNLKWGPSTDANPWHVPLQKFRTSAKDVQFIVTAHYTVAIMHNVMH